MQPFFSYYGAKWRTAEHYPRPSRSTIIEPFAGAAGYAVRYYHKQVRLFDVSPIICGVWDFLIKSDAAEILRIPSVVENVDDLLIPQEAKWLIGFWLHRGGASPIKKPSGWALSDVRAKSYWGQGVKERIASQVSGIKHWTITQLHYDLIENEPATWFVDPPYHCSGVRYKYHDIDYSHLAEWSKSRLGQVVVCEQEGASWLPFQDFHSIDTTDGRSKSKEVVWLKGC